jgi:hypothetical protein
MRPIAEGLGSAFANLERRTKEVLDLTAQVRLTLSGPEKHHVLSAGYEGETLVIVADSAAWCPQIRYAQQQILAAFNAAGETHLTKLKVRVGRTEGDRG